MNKTDIEWADMVWNPTTGCSKASAGCLNCYAEAIAHRFWGERKFTDVQCHPERLDQPAKVCKPQRVFVDSMSDLFHNDVPDEFIEEVFMVMALKARQHTYMILTKRPKRMMEFMNGHHECVQSHIWLGVSIEDQKTANERVPLLLQTSGVVRFVSVEPMLSRIKFDSIWLHGCDAIYNRHLDWVICGGEGGVHARKQPPYIDFRFIKDQCVNAGIPFFLKQMYGKKMPELDEKVWNQFPLEA